MLLNVTRFTEALDNARNNGLKTRYGNFIGGKFVDPVQGRYFTDHSPINGEKLADIARSSPRRRRARA
jgi:aldehyde dehydrogenase